MAQNKAINATESTQINKLRFNAATRSSCLNTNNFGTYSANHSSQPHLQNYPLLSAGLWKSLFYISGELLRGFKKFLHILRTLRKWQLKVNCKETLVQILNAYRFIHEVKHTAPPLGRHFLINWITGNFLPEQGRSRE